MKYKSIGKSEAALMLTNWRRNPETISPDVSYIDLRGKLVSAYQDIKEKTKKPILRQSNMQDPYIIDLEFGLRIYEILNITNDFTLRVAADDGVWRYLAVAVVPDLVADRWGINNDDHYWAKPTRNWLRQLWWYIHISWNENLTLTRDTLKDNSTDEILNLVERVGKGYNTNTYRQIMHRYKNVSLEVRTAMKRGKSKTLFRTLMILNTAFTQTIEPGLFQNSEEGYVRWLFESAGLIREFSGGKECWKQKTTSTEA